MVIQQSSGKSLTQHQHLLLLLLLVHLQLGKKENAKDELPARVPTVMIRVKGKINTKLIHVIRIFKSYLEYEQNVQVVRPLGPRTLVFVLFISILN